MVKSGIKTALAFVAGFIWMIFVTLFLWSYADGFTLLENFVILLVSLAVFSAVSWPLTRKTKPDKQKATKIPPTWMILTTVLLGTAWLVFTIIALVFLDCDYSTYQKLALIVLAAMIITGPIGVMWVRWGMKQKIVA